jgi:hypothetical protein
MKGGALFVGLSVGAAATVLYAMTALDGAPQEPRSRIRAYEFSESLPGDRPSPQRARKGMAASIAASVATANLGRTRAGGPAATQASDSAGLPPV